MGAREERREDRTSEESVMRSLNTDAGRVKYIAGKSETKKRSLKKDETEWFNELDGKGFLGRN